MGKVSRVIFANLDNLDQGQEMIIFVSILTTFEDSFVFFEAAGAEMKMGEDLVSSNFCLFVQ
jgi:hypothetical protein